jgi:hypothetical protein
LKKDSSLESIYNIQSGKSSDHLGKATKTDHKHHKPIYVYTLGINMARQWQCYHQSLLLLYYSLFLLCPSLEDKANKI